ncbi:MFS general substrate transporter [Cyathus striatus]|nr:MFS general substrate transporter [Cyathus striatus]
MIGSALLFSFSYYMLSISQKDKYYQIFLSQGVGSGLAVGIAFIPSMGIVSHYFHKRRTFAMGIVAAGTALGAVIHPLILNSLFQGSQGFQRGVRISTAINTTVLFVANLLMRTRLSPQKKSDAIPLSAFARDMPYIFVVLGDVAGMFGLQFPNFFLQLYAINLGVSNVIAFRCLSILNGASFVGRVLFPLLASRCGVFNLNIFFTASMGIMLYSFLAVKNGTGVIIFAVVYGILSGGAISYTPPMMASLAKNVGEIGSRIGVAFAFSGCVGLVATTIAGALLTTQYIWWRPIVFSGSTTVLSATFFAVSRYVISKREKTQVL